MCFFIGFRQIDSKMCFRYRTCRLADEFIGNRAYKNASSWHVASDTRGRCFKSRSVAHPQSKAHNWTILSTSVLCSFLFGTISLPFPFPFPIHLFQCLFFTHTPKPPALLLLRIVFAVFWFVFLFANTKIEGFTLLRWSPAKITFGCETTSRFITFIMRH